MSAHCRADKNGGVSCRGKTDLTHLIKKGRTRILVLFLVDFLSSQSSNEDWCSVPNNLKDFSWRNLRDLDFEIGVTIVTGPSVKSSNDCNCVKAAEVGKSCIVDGAEHVDLGSTDVSLMFVVDPVLIEPVIDVGFEIDVISEVAGSC